MRKFAAAAFDNPCDGKLGAITTTLQLRYRTTTEPHTVSQNSISSLSVLSSFPQSLQILPRWTNEQKAKIE
jgi:hypothetical protein